MMPLLAHRAVDTHISEILEVAETVVKRNFNSDLIDKVTVLKGYWELSRMRPEQDYGLVLSRALADLTPVVHSHLTRNVHKEANVSGAAYRSVRAL